MELFTGLFTHSIDAKNRVSVPRKVLDVLKIHKADRQVVVNLGLDGCLWLYPPGAYASLGESINAAALGNRDVRSLARTFFSRAEACSVDGHGRMLLPDSLKRVIGLEDKVVFAGVGDRVELWRPDTWERFQEASLATYEDQAGEVFVAKGGLGPRAEPGNDDRPHR